MSNTFQVGKQYKLVDANKLAEFIINADQLSVPDVFTCTSLSGDSCHSTTEGVLWRGLSKFSWDSQGWCIADHDALAAGVFVEVTDAS